MPVGTVATFALYLIGMLAIGLYFYRRTRTLGDYLVGGRQLNAWVTALSAQASDMSGWLLMGLPGAVFLAGLGELWMVLGLAVGTLLNWLLVAPRLRRQSEEYGAITLPGYFERRFGRTRTGIIGALSALVTFFFFSIYSAAGLVAAGLLFEAVLGVDYALAVWAGAAVILLYTTLGGFLAVAWTDLVQGLMILAALLVVPALALVELGGFTPVWEAMAAKGISARLWPDGEGLTWLGVISAAAWGLGYFGQPHILVRFMAARDVRELPRARNIAMVWVLLSLAGAVLVGLAGVAWFPEGLDKPERVFIHLVGAIFDPWIGGILLAAILAAIMSTIDSQLLVASSAVAEDFYAGWARTAPSEGRLLWIGRGAVLAITLVAAWVAMDRESTVLGLVAYAWAGLGASFGPVVLLALSWRRMTYAGAVAGMLAGAGTLLAWKLAGLGAHLYEIVPGFAAGCLAIVLVSYSSAPPASSTSTSAEPSSLA